MLAPLLAAIVSAIFAGFVLYQYRAHRRAYQLMWGIGLAFFAIAAFAGYIARSGGATAGEYALFYLFGAILNVAWLGLGTLYLLTPRQWANAALVVVLALSVAGVYAVLSAPIDLAAVADNGKGFPEGSLPRILAAIGSGAGSIILIGGALYSAGIFAWKRHNGRRAAANVIIALGVLIVAAGGTTALFTGAAGLVEITNLVGVSVMFAGFLLA